MGLFGGTTMTREEPRINSLRIQQSTYGVVIPIVMGTTRITGNVIDYDDFTAIPHTTTQTSGKGGSVTQSETTYTYTAAMIIALCEAPVTAIGKVWASKEIVTLAEKKLALYQNQIWPYMTGNHPDKALRYKNTAYVAGVIDLGSSAEAPNFSFEVFGQYQYGSGVVDANPSVAVRELLCNAIYGVNFPAEYVADLSLYSQYAVANSFFISLSLTEQKECRENILDILSCTNSEAIWSQGKIKIIPYGDEPMTGNGATYIPPPAPLYDLTEDDFIPDDDEEPVICSPGGESSYNIQPFEFINRDNDYNIESDDVRDYADISINGSRTAESIKMHLFCRKDAAKKSAQARLQRNLYGRTKYEFKLGWKHLLLEPMDIVTLTERCLGLNKEPVRILEIEELDDQRLQIVAEECPDGINGVTSYPSQLSIRAQINYNAPPRSVNSPVIFEPPFLVTENALEVWIAVSGPDPNWGGCSVWVSEDGDTFRFLDTINGPARHGVLMTNVPAGDAVDTEHTLSVMLVGGDELRSGTLQDAISLNNLLWVDGELLAYRDAVLTGPREYTLSYLVRGAYQTNISDHAAGSYFARMDQAIFRYSFQEDLVGRPIYIKLASHNVFGGGQQDLSELDAYTYYIQGSALYAPLSDVENVKTYYENGIAVITWDRVSDYRNPVEYEIRKGVTYAASQTVGRTTEPKFIATGNDTYWIVAVYRQARSKNPIAVVVDSARISQNVVASYSEQETGWTGSTGYGITLVNGYLKYNSPEPAYYTIPDNHIISLGQATLCNVSYSIEAYGNTIAYEFDSIADVDDLVNFDGTDSSQISAKIEIDTMNDAGNWNGWRECVPGQYYGKKFNFRLAIHTFNTSIAVLVNGFYFAVDVPDKLYYAQNITIDASGTTILYPSSFCIIPSTQITINNQQSGDVIVLTNETVSYCRVQITNNGIGVSRNVNITAAGY